MSRYLQCFCIRRSMVHLGVWYLVEFSIAQNLYLNVLYNNVLSMYPQGSP
jgi:hypothetical protein